jgi:hypothetical protein
MKVLAILTLITVTTSCGKINLQGKTGLGAVREIVSENISTSDHVSYDAICQALTTKGLKLDSFRSPQTFDVEKKDCEGNPDTTLPAVQQVNIEPSTSGYLFRRIDNNALFVFPSVETSQFGVMKEICGGATQMPIVNGGEARWIRTGTFEDCKAVKNEQCVLVETGSKMENSTSYRVNTVEYIRFNLDRTSGKYGYYTHRKILASSTCEDNKKEEVTADLR